MLYTAIYTAAPPALEWGRLYRPSTVVRRALRLVAEAARAPKLDDVWGLALGVGALLRFGAPAGNETREERLKRALSGERPNCHQRVIDWCSAQVDRVPASKALQLEVEIEHLDLLSDAKEMAPPLSGGELRRLLERRDDLESLCAFAWTLGCEDGLRDQIATLDRAVRPIISGMIDPPPILVSAQLAGVALVDPRAWWAHVVEIRK